MRCPQCRGSVPEGKRECPLCGADFQGLTEAPTVDQSPPVSRGKPEFLPGERFAARYTIVEKIGEGGMGIVYKAIDNDLRQEVALKLIQPEHARQPAFRERFRREVRLTRRIHHPNVCRVHDLGESDGVLFFSMEWIEGQTLQKILRQAGRLDEDRALQIAGKMARALGTAHSEGIVHRDLKPGNVMIDDRGEVHVMDFGLATEQRIADSGKASAVVGTPPYMAPEQLRGETVDGRADLFSLGLILREMLTGQPPGVREGRRAGVGSRVSPILRSLLAENRDERCDSAEVAGRELERLQGTTGRSRVLHRWKQGVKAHKVSVLGVALAAALALAAVLVFVLPGRTPRDSTPSVAFYQRGMHYLREEAETVRSLDDAVQMFHRATQEDPSFAPAWAGRGEAYWKRFEMTGDPSSREEAEKAVARAFELDPSLPDAHNARARGLMAQGRFEEAKQELKMALQEVPGFDAAWANLGFAHQQLGEYSEGLEALRAAIRIRPDSHRHRVSLGLFYWEFGELDEAGREFRKASDLKPDSTMAWTNLGGILLELNRPEEAVTALLRSLEIDERAATRTQLGTAYYFLKDYAQAASNYERATVLEPWSVESWGNLGDARRMLGEADGARAAYLEAVRLARERTDLAPQDALARSLLGQLCARAGLADCAVSEGKRAAELQPDNTRVLFRNAVIACVLGEAEQALDWLERAVDLGLSKAMIENDPDLASLNHLPRYRAILKRAS